MKWRNIELRFTLKGFLLALIAIVVFRVLPTLVWLLGIVIVIASQLIAISVNLLNLTKERDLVSKTIKEETEYQFIRGLY